MGCMAQVDGGKLYSQGPAGRGIQLYAIESDITRQNSTLYHIPFLKHVNKNRKELKKLIYFKICLRAWLMRARK